MPKLLKLFHKTEIEGTVPNSFYKATFILIYKPHKYVKYKENYSSFPLYACMKKYSMETKFKNEPTSK